MLSLIILNLISNYNVQTEETKKSKKNSEENDEFDDPSLLKNEDNISPSKKKQKKTKSNNDENKNKSKKESTSKTESDDIYPSIEKIKQDEIIEMNKYQYFILTYLYDISMVSFLLLFILVAILGVKKNRNIANKWLEKNIPFFEENYAHLGGEREYNPNNLSLIKDSYNDYKFFASGRVYVGWCLVDINLKRRQDLITLLSQIFLFTEKDRIMYEISVLPSDDIPMIFAICKRKDVKYNKKTYNEIKEFTEGINLNFMDNNYICLCEDEDTISQIFSNKKLVAQYKKIEKFIDLIFFTDRRNCKDKHGLIVSFELKSSYTEADFSDMTLFAHMLVDILGGLSLRSSYKKEAMARRKEYDAKKSRELAEKNKEEVKNAKEEKRNAAYNKPMTREQMQKLEEKERKEAIKERRKKLYKMVKN